jgi:glycosyltransferase involved in cell wall biosynthesis
MTLNNTRKLVSVIIPTYNREKYLEEAIRSVINQSYKNFEILVIDDGSSNNYAESICNKYDNCFYLFKKNGGLSSARNFGVKKAKGKYIAFLDDDDFWKKEKLEKQVELLDNYPKIDCVHSSAMVVNEKGQQTGQVIGASQNKIHKRSGYVFWNALGVWVIKSPTPLIRKSVFKPDLLFDETIKVGEDIDFYQRMFFRHKIFYINEPLAFYREYKNVTRLSLQLEKYVGVEKKQMLNLKKMNIKNPIYIYLITLRLAKAAQKRISLLNKRNYTKSLFFRIKFTLRPKLYLYHFSKL